MAEIIKRKITELKKLPKNPRQIKGEDFAVLMDSLANNPELFDARPIILSDRTGELVIIAGNMRFEAAKKIGMLEVPTILISNLDEAKEREIAIRDNINNGDWDWDILANDWSHLPLADWGLEVETWVDQFEAEKTESEASETESKVTLCPSCGYNLSDGKA